MKRLLALVLTMGILAACLVGCGDTNERLSRKTVREIQANWLERVFSHVTWPLEWHDEMYLGTYNGYIVFVWNRGDTDVPYEFTLKGETFRADFDFMIYLFKDREFFDLKLNIDLSEELPDRVEQQISDEDVRAIAERFRAYVQWYESQERE